MAIAGGRPNNRQISPSLFVRNADRAIEFYKRAFDAVLLYRSPMPGGVGIFAQMRIGDSTVQIADESPPDDIEPDSPRSPQSLGGYSVVFERYVDDVDAAFKQAVDAGATPTLPPQDMFFGDRYCWLTDPFGHRWALATVRQTLTPEQIERNIEEHLAEYEGKELQ